MPLGIGLVGAGSIADYHLDGLAAAGGNVVRAVAARSPERARHVAARHGVPEVLTDWRALLDRSDIQAVVIATPDHTHEEIACAALAAGKAVLVQKPMASSSAACRTILAAARSAQVPLEVSFMHRYFPEVRLARAMLAAGDLGPVHAARVRNATPGPDWDAWFWRRDLVGGGVVLQLGVHGIDLVRHLLGNSIVSLVATTALRRRRRVLRDGSVVEPDNEDHAHALYRLASGADAVHEMSFADPGGTDRFAMEIHAERASLHLRGARGPLAVFRRGWDVSDIPQEPQGAAQHRAFLDVAAGRAPPTGSDQDGLAGILVAEAIYVSAASGRVVDVPQPETAAALPSP